MPTITSTIPISKGVGLPTLEISDVDWKKGQAEFGCEILHETRKKIIEVTREYMSQEWLIILADPKSMALKQIQKIESAAADLHAAIMKPGNLYARSLIAMRLASNPLIGLKFCQGLANPSEQDFQDIQQITFPDNMPVLQDVNGDLVTDSNGNPVPDMKTIAIIGFELPSSGVSGLPGPQQRDLDQSAPAVSEPAEATAPSYKAHLSALRSMALKADTVARACKDALRLPERLANDRIQGAIQRAEADGVTLTEAEAIHRVQTEHDVLHVSSDGFRRGEAWGPWIRQLKTICKAAGLKVAARKDDPIQGYDRRTNKRQIGKQSEFVMFVKWLQERISEEYLRSIGRTWAGGAIDTVTARAAADTVLRARGQTAAALAVAISKELRDPKARSPVS